MKLGDKNQSWTDSQESWTSDWPSLREKWTNLREVIETFKWLQKLHFAKHMRILMRTGYIEMYVF